MLCKQWWMPVHCKPATRRRWWTALIQRIRRAAYSFFYNTGNNQEGEVRNEAGLREVWYKTSADGGVTWIDTINITTQVHRPKQPAANAAYNFLQDWHSYVNTRGHDLQFQGGTYKGRIFVAANYSAGGP